MTDIKALVGVIVLYKCSIEESNTIQSLNKALVLADKRLKLLLYDNGPERQIGEENFEYGNFEMKYQHDPSNPGISKAYNEGAQYATSLGAKWILLLDQDTIFGGNIFDSYLGLVTENLPSEIACIIPQVLSAKYHTLISPSKVYPGGILRPASDIEPGIINKPITSINAGALISVQFIISIGGFCEEYPLDMLDHWYFREIFRKKKKVLLLAAKIHHNLSVVSFFNEVSKSRYNNILLSERKFFQGNWIDLCVYKLRLVLRLFNQLKVGQKEYAKLTLKYLRR